MDKEKVGEWQKVRDAASQKEAAKTRALQAARIAAEAAAPPVVKPSRRKPSRKAAAPDDPSQKT